MFSLNLNGRAVEFERPAVMGIINITDDSFYEASRAVADEAIASRAESMIAAGADILDLGAYSSRPGAGEVAAEVEAERICRAVRVVRSLDREIPLSIDTFRASVAEAGLSAGADIVNDISGGMADEAMDALVAQANVPFIIMHMRGTPQTMSSLTDYSASGSVTAEVMQFFARRIERLESLGAYQIILDPGFGFAKTVEQNWQLMSELPLICRTFPQPVLVGVSRKSMLYKPLGITPEESLPATCYANTLAL